MPVPDVKVCDVAESTAASTTPFNTGPLTLPPAGVAVVADGGDGVKTCVVDPDCVVESPPMAMVVLGELRDFGVADSR